MTEKTAFIILGAGKGVRMVSDLPKVMHAVGGEPMIMHLVHTAETFKPEKIVCVIGPGMDMIKETVAPHKTAVQEKPLGTGSAALAAAAELEGFEGNVFILYADSPMMSRESMLKMLEARKKYSGVVLGFRPDDPKKYGRLLMNKDESLEAIVEYKDATDVQRKVNFCNSGAQCVDGKLLFKYLRKITNNNAAKEYYLTDLVELMRKDGLKYTAVEGSPEEMEGANTREELAALEHSFQTKIRKKVMAEGITLVDPETTYFSTDTTVGKDTVIEPGVFFGPKVHIGTNCHIKAFQRLENVTLKDKTVK